MLCKRRCARSNWRAAFAPPLDSRAACISSYQRKRQTSEWSKLELRQVNTAICSARQCCAFDRHIRSNTVAFSRFQCFLQRNVERRFRSVRLRMELDHQTSTTACQPQPLEIAIAQRLQDTPSVPRRLCTKRQRQTKDKANVFKLRGPHLLSQFTKTLNDPELI